MASYRFIGTYDDDTYGSLSPLPDHLFDGSFAWLTPQSARHSDIDGRSRPFDRRLIWDGLVLPNAFFTFMGSDVLARSIPETCNSWNMSMRPVPRPVERHAHRVQFLAAVQGFGYW